MLVPRELQVKVFLDIGCTVGAVWVCESKGRSAEELQRDWNDEQEAWVQKNGYRPARKHTVVQT